MLYGRKDFIDVGFDALSATEVVDRILDADAEEPFRYVVTPNVDHMIRIQASQEIAGLYRRAWLCINDSRVLQLLARVFRVSLPATPGADLVVDLLRDARLPLDAPLMVVGGHAGLADEMKALLGRRTIVQHRPPMGLLHDPEAFDAVLDAVEASGARLVFLAVGSPQQEYLAAALVARGRARGIGLCIGASLEFLVGTRRRAPHWMRALYIEWVFRLCAEPRRLAARYLVGAPRILGIALAYRRARSARLQRG